MSEAWIIDAVAHRAVSAKARARWASAPAAPGRHGFGHRSATSWDTAEVDDIIFGTSSQRGQQGGDLARMAALDGYSRLPALH